MWPEPIIHVDPAWRGALRGVLRVPDALDPAALHLSEAIRADIDFVLGGRNLTAAFPPEKLLPFFQGLVGAIADLAEGSARKAIVQFAESPWEMALVRHPGDTIALSLYEVVAPARVLAEAVEVRLTSLQRACLHALEHLLAESARLPHHLTIDRWIRRLRDCERRVRAVDLRPLAPVHPRGASPARLPVETRNSAGLLLVTELRAPQQSLLDYDGELPLDRHALLVPGTFAIVPDDQRGWRVEGRPLFALEALLDALLPLAQEPPKPGSTDVQPVAGRWCSLRVDATDLVLVPDGTASQDGHTIRMPRIELLLALAQHIEDVHAACLTLNPLLDVNGHLRDLLQEARGLRRRILEQTASTHRLHALRLRREAALSEAQQSARTAAFPFAFEDVRLLRLERAWSRSLPADGTCSTRALEDQLVTVRCARELRLIDGRDGEDIAHLPIPPGGNAAVHGLHAATTGEYSVAFHHLARGPLWAVPTPDDEGVQSLRVSESIVLLAYRSGRVEARRFRDGALRWQSRVDVGVAPLLATAPGLVLLGSRDGRVRAVDRRSGDTRWTVDAGLPLRVWSVTPGALCLGLWHGRQERGGLDAFDLTSGRLLSRVREHAEHMTFDARGSLAAIIETADARTLHALGPEASPVVTRAELPLAFQPGPVACRVHDRTAWILADGVVRAWALGPMGGEQWALPLPDARKPSLQAPEPALAIHGDVLAVAGRELSLVSATTGRVVQRLAHPLDSVIDLHLGPRAAVTLLEEGPSGDRILTRWRTSGLLAPLG
ncbi:MAG: hypothetical protein EA398_02850 [Deltaproteobacteria bacterium]|nr:MAG: hypothetical protein EA398_02850 [Deltaproteobacteria bacterium]